MAVFSAFVIGDGVVPLKCLEILLQTGHQVLGIYLIHSISHCTYCLCSLTAFAHLLPLLSEAQQHQILVEWNQTAKPYPRDRSIHSLWSSR
jgi:hypothetical protein